MGAASYLQCSFLGGEVSKHMQGRADRQDYRSWMNLCRNAIPIEEGAATRRPGTLLAGVTRQGKPGVLREFHFNQANPYTMELTDGFLRFRRGAQMVSVDEIAVQSIIDDGAPQVTTEVEHGWVEGDQVVFHLVDGPHGPYGDIAVLLGGRQFTVQAGGGPSDFYLLDGVDPSINLLGRITLGSNLLTVSKIQEYVTPYPEASLQSIRTVQDEDNAILLEGGTKPHVVTVVTPEADSLTGMAGFSFEPAVFTDGPYLDPPEPSDNSYLTPSALTGTILLAQTGAFVAFQGTDVGRLIRLQSEPEDWAAGTYSMDDVVKFNEAYYKCVVATTTTQPDLSLDDWAVDVTAAAWTWGTIVEVIDADNIRVTLAPADPAGIKAGGDLLYTLPIKTWRLGVYSDTTGYPTCGTFHEGRLWLGSNAGNRIDGSMSNRTFDFAPTSRDGTVADNNGISAVFKATDRNRPVWLLPDARGILVGTQAGEWMVRASDLNEPLTPTSIQAHRETDFGCEDIEARVLPISKVFIQRNRRKMIELAGAGYGGTKMFQGQDLSLKAKHFCADGLAEIAYQKEKTPIIWARTDTNELIGCTYRRDAQIASDPVTFAGWHKHTHGCGHEIVSIQAGPAVGGDTDTLNLLTRDPDTGIHYVELLTDIFQEDDVIQDAWFLDGAVNPAGADVLTIDGAQIIRYYGLDYQVGETVTAWVAGVDMGEFVVSDDGTIDVPFTSANQLLTPAYAATLADRSFNYSTEAYSDVGTTTLYIMEVSEGYPPVFVSKLDAAFAPNSTTRTEQVYFGMSVDRIRRKFLYPFIWSVNNGTTTNTTGFTINNGDAIIVAPGATYNDQNVKNFFLMEKDLDTGVVKSYDAFDPAFRVPTGVNTSDGTHRLVMFDTETEGNLPGLTDPRSGDYFGHTQSCELFQLRRQDKFALSVFPLFPVTDPGANVIPIAMTDDWVYGLETGVSDVMPLYMVPREIQTAERTAGYKLSYQDYATTFTEGEVIYRHAVTPEGTLYFVTQKFTGAGAIDYKLYRFDPPDFDADPMSVSGGGFSTVTPWDGTHGPNAQAVAGSYTAQSDVNGFNKMSLAVVPTQNGTYHNLAIFAMLYPADKGSSDLADFRMSLTIVRTEVDTMPAAATQNVVKGLMKTGTNGDEWTPATNLADAGYEVVFVREHNQDLVRHTFTFDDVDYSQVWFSYECYKVTAGVVDTSAKRTVFIRHVLAFSTAGAFTGISVDRVIDEEGWNLAYPTYQAGLLDGEEHVIQGSMSTDWTSYPGDPEIGINIADGGFWDRQTGTFWFSGQNRNVHHFNAYYTTRVGFSSESRVKPPFLKLTFGRPPDYNIPTSIGCAYTTDGQIVRPISSAETGAITGPASGKTRRTQEFAALFHNTQGVSLGTDFAKLRPALFKTPGGTDYTKLQLFSGTYQDPLEDSYSFDSMICWRITRPYPATVLSLTGFIHTMDR